DNAGAGSVDYMHLFGLVGLGYMWAKIAKTINDKLESGPDGKEDWLKAKLTFASFFMERTMPETSAHLARISSGADTLMSLDANAF
ncbi:MAG: acyl-CoA dehydrogenase C-terminal domain-containing protein, partial [Roseibium sp.]